MKYIILPILFLSAFAIASNDNNDSNISKTKAKIIEEQVKQQMKKEEKYAREQKFYTAKDYDFNGSRINKASLSHIEVIKPDDPSLDSEAILGDDFDDNRSW